jgi:hypothetical protein
VAQASTKHFLQKQPSPSTINNLPRKIEAGRKNDEGITLKWKMSIFADDL